MLLMNDNKINTTFLRLLSVVWGWVTFVMFFYDFFSQNINTSISSTTAVIYGVILALYVSTKEFKRWGSKKGEYKSLYSGEFYPIFWSAAMLFFVILSFSTDGLYKIPNEFPATYITILGIYIITQQSKVIYAKKR